MTPATQHAIEIAIRTEHLLLGLLQTGQGLARAVLADAGLRVDAVRRSIRHD